MPAPGFARRALAVALLAAASAGQAAEPQLPQLNLRYAAAWKGISLGDVLISLKPDGGPDCYRYQSVSEPIGMVRMFYGTPHETSQFCLSGGRVVPRRFSFINNKDEASSFSLEFDVAAGTVRDGRGDVRKIPSNAQDRFGLQHAVRLWVLGQLAKKEVSDETVDFAMVDDRRIKTYRFAITGREEVETPAGRFETVLVQRVDDPNKSSKFWLAPSRDYMPVKVEQIKRGSSDLKMVLKSQ
jgi:hypothetical protein